MLFTLQFNFIKLKFKLNETIEKNMKNIDS